MDLLLILGTLAFFAIAIAYTVACDRLKEIAARREGNV
jgi:hypothetical protein